MQKTEIAQSTLLDELELRQNEILQQLDDLNRRIEGLLAGLRDFDRSPVVVSNSET